MQQAFRASVRRQARHIKVAENRLSDGSTIPWLSYGNGSEDADIPFRDIGEQVIDAGFRAIDTASVSRASVCEAPANAHEQGYAGATREAQTGELLDLLDIAQDQIYLTSKREYRFKSYSDLKLRTVSPIRNWTEPMPLAQVKPTVLESRKKLRRTPNLYLIHTPNSVPKGTLGDAWKMLEDLKDEGVLRSIGVSNFTELELEQILKVCRYKPSGSLTQY
jgi:diketogulonate reductase-like aldo/keto reductase